MQQMNIMLSNAKTHSPIFVVRSRSEMRGAEQFYSIKNWTARVRDNWFWSALNRERAKAMERAMKNSIKNFCLTMTLQKGIENRLAEIVYFGRCVYTTFTRTVKSEIGAARDRTCRRGGGWYIFMHSTAPL